MLTEFQVTNSGLRITLPILDDLCNDINLAVLNVTVGEADDVSRLACLCQENAKNGNGSFVFMRSHNFPQSIIAILRCCAEGLGLSSIYILHTQFCLYGHFNPVPVSSRILIQIASSYK